MKSPWGFLLAIFPTTLFGGRFAKTNTQMLTLHCKQQWELTLFLKSAAQNCKLLVLAIWAMTPLSTLLLSLFVVAAQKLKTLWLNHHVATEMLPKTIKKIARTVKAAADIGLPHQDRDAIKTFPTSKNLINLTSGTPPRNSNNQRNNSKVCFSDNSKRNKRDWSSSSQPNDEEKMLTLWLNQSFQSWVQSMFQLW